jgi:Tol biopolymer transport system component
MLLEPGAQPRPLTNTMHLNARPTFSRDGRRLAFVSDRDGKLEIYQIYN